MTKLTWAELRELRAVKAERIESSGSCCERCGTGLPGDAMQLHYRLDVRHPDALELLCFRCYPLAVRECEEAHPLFDERLGAFVWKHARMRLADLSTAQRARFVEMYFARNRGDMPLFPSPAGRDGSRRIIPPGGPHWTKLD